ncbi:MAG: transcription elongation factor GreA [Gammaproteobacteria bacterium]|nr:transcription elongation factor GreA [Gammaproteobacteria bacterium]
MNNVPMTAIGAAKLTEELERLKRVERPSVTKAIAEARSHGDLKENAEYHAAKEQQGFIEARIRDIEHRLSRASIIDVTKLTNEGKVVFGATVSLVNVESDEEVVYQIVGEEEADIRSGKLSFTSPIARAIIGKYSGDSVEVRTPSGLIEYEIGNVQYL